MALTKEEDFIDMIMNHAHGGDADAKEASVISREIFAEGRDDALPYVEIVVRGSGHKYSDVFLRSKHPDRYIIARVQTTATYMGKVVGTETQQLKASPKADILLGQNGWNNPSGFDTKYERSLLHAWFA